MHVNPPAPLAWSNGRLVPQAEAGLPLHDAGLVLGATVTDLVRTFRHRLFRWPDHLRRFRESCRLACVPLPASDADLTLRAEQLVEHNASLLKAEQDLALVLLATPGPIGWYLGQAGGPGEGEPTLILHTFPLPFARYARLFREGARLFVPSVRQVPADCVDPRIKQRSRLHWWLAERETQQMAPGSSALLLDQAGLVTETAAANLLVVRSGVVLSPPRTAVLGGISLQVTEELCGWLGIPFAEQQLRLEDCLTADEAWLCSTPYGVAGVRQINETVLPWPGPLLPKLRRAWDELVGLNVAEQMERGGTPPR